MHQLSAHDVLRIWEVGQGQAPPERALTVLQAAFPEWTRDQLADLRLGQRDGWLLAVREALFGPQMQAFAECPRCRERLEFTLDVATIRSADSAVPVAEELSLAAEEFALRFRLPTTRDLAAVAECANPQQGRAVLVQRCLLQARREGVDVPASRLPEGVLARMAERLLECDPQAEVSLDLLCPACGHAWQSTLDIAEFLWAELAAQARRLLREVHTLARAYGWREADILALSARRRQCYLEMVGQ